MTVLKPGTRRSLAVDDIGKAAAAAIIESDRFDEVEVGRGQEPVTQAGERVVWPVEQHEPCVITCEERRVSETAPPPNTYCSAGVTTHVLPTRTPMAKPGALVEHRGRTELGDVLHVVHPVRHLDSQALLVVAPEAGEFFHPPL